MIKYCIINTTNKSITEKLESYGYKCISTQFSNDTSQPIALHADVLYLHIKDNSFIISACQKENIALLENMGATVQTEKLYAGYNTESKLNIVFSDNYIVYNPKTAIDIEKYKHRKKLVEVKQGYSKCSTVVLPNDCFITEDKSIYNALNNLHAECLFITKGLVKLSGYDYGFIGGASVYLNPENTLLFFGDITKHVDYNNIKFFCDKNNIKIDYIPQIHLEDIGGGVLYITD